ncbi:MAG: alpha/beta fold hydrolase, partial [Spirochaetales bacterium]
SMGGKTAMEVALQAPDRVNRLIVADMGPARHEAHFSDVLSALDGYDISRLQNRAEAEKGLAEIIPDRNIRLFVLKNLKRRPQGSWFWQANIPALARHYGELCAGIEGGGRTFSGRSLFLKGERSGYLEDSEIPAVRELFPRAEIKIIPAAGHWLHIDNQDAFVDEVLSFCES